MVDKSPAEKLRLKSGMAAAILRAPDGVDLGVPDSVTLTEDLKRADFILIFVTTQAEAEERARDVAGAATENTVAWISYPKGSKAKGLDISRDTIWTFARTVGLVLNANISIDETWSAVRMRPLRPGE